MWRMELGQGEDPEVIKLALQAEGLAGPVHNRPFRWIGNHLWRTVNGYYQLVVPAGGGLRELALQEAHGSAKLEDGTFYVDPTTMDPEKDALGPWTWELRIE